MNQPIHALPEVLSGERRVIRDKRAGEVIFYVDGPGQNTPEDQLKPRPVLLVHSINASASAHEVKPLFDALKQDRQTYAIDLPGFGHSEHSDRDYLQALMVDAIKAVLEVIRHDTETDSVDTLAVSLSCEFLAKAALKCPDLFHSLALVSPTGFAKNTSTKGTADDDLGRSGVLKFLKRPRIGRGLYRLLSSKPSIRFFLRKTWGRKEIDEEMFETSCLMSEHPYAHRAPFYFLSGYLFSANIPMAFEALTHPVWLTHGVRGDFTDFSRAQGFADKANWRIKALETGALPYFEVTEPFVEGWKSFIEDIETERHLNEKRPAQGRAVSV